METVMPVCGKKDEQKEEWLLTLQQLEFFALHGFDAQAPRALTT